MNSKTRSVTTITQWTLCAILALSTALSAAPVSFETALRTAENAAKSKKLYLKHKTLKKPAAAENAPALLYVFQNDGDRGGFVIIAGDDVFKPIIGISETGIYDHDDLPPAFSSYIEEMELEMESALTNGQTQTQAVKSEWARYAAGEAYVPGTYLIKTQWDLGTPYSNNTPYMPVPRTARAVTGRAESALRKGLAQTRDTENEWARYAAGEAYVPGTYLVKTGQREWNNGDPYNNRMPYKTGSQSRVSPSSSVMSVAKIMNYHKYPKEAIATIPEVFSKEANAALPALPPYAFEWDIMADTFSYSPYWKKTAAQKEAHENALGDLTYAVWRAVEAKGIIGALTTYFGYDSGIKSIARAKYTAADWAKILRDQIDAGLPVYYGNGLVLDGYDDNGMFHFGGGGFFVIAMDYHKVRDGLDNIFYKQQAIINIRPGAKR